MTHPNEGHKFNRYCLKHGHDWQYYTYDCQKCAICGAMRKTLDKYNRAGLLAYPVTVKPRIRRLE